MPLQILADRQIGACWRSVRWKSSGKGQCIYHVAYMHLWTGKRIKDVHKYRWGPGNGSCRPEVVSLTTIGIGYASVLTIAGIYSSSAGEANTVNRCEA